MLVKSKRLLVLVIDEMSQINAPLLAGAEQNIRQCVYNGRLTVVLLFVDD